jgi:hypothetical protein
MIERNGAPSRSEPPTEIPFELPTASLYLADMLVEANGGPDVCHPLVSRPRELLNIARTHRLFGRVGHFGDEECIWNSASRVRGIDGRRDLIAELVLAWSAVVPSDVAVSLGIDVAGSAAERVAHNDR